jgi:hypothetical protein
VIHCEDPEWESLNTLHIYIPVVPLDPLQSTSTSTSTSISTSRNNLNRSQGTCYHQHLESHFSHLSPCALLASQSRSPPPMAPMAPMATPTVIPTVLSMDPPVSNYPSTTSFSDREAAPQSHASVRCNEHLTNTLQIIQGSPQSQPAKTLTDQRTHTPASATS